MTQVQLGIVLGVMNYQANGRIHDMKRRALQSHLDLLLLATIADRQLHGYAIVEALRSVSRGKVDLATGTVYPALQRLEYADWISGTWSVVNGRRRRTYRLTEAGRFELNDRRAEWEELRDLVTTVLCHLEPSN